MTWDEAGARYQAEMLDATHAMFLQTMQRVKQEVHTDVPKLLLKTYVRWMMNDPNYQTQFLRYVSRAIDPVDFKIEPSISPRIVFRGVRGDILKALA